jgi:4-amino-4-deoxy-L-arabinose transferase-like glycosyltransferase
MMSSLKNLARTWPLLTVGLLITLITLFRFWYCTTLELLPDESYYFLWSKHLDASYYSKGPGIAWTIAFGTWLMGDTVFGIRWLSVMLAAGTSVQIWWLARRLFGDEVAWRSLWIALVMPLLAVGGVLMTIDPLCMFFWVWAANLFLTASDPSPGSERITVASGRWAAVGFAVGLGVLAKFVNALEWLAFFAFLLTHSQRRAWLKRPEFWLALGVFVLCITPIFYWNQHHGWITATHLKQRGKLESHFSLHPGEFLEFLLHQALVWSPFLFAAMMAVATWSLARWREMDEARRFALCLFWPIFGFYLILALNDDGEANWTATGLIGGILLLAPASLEWEKRSATWLTACRAGWSVGLIMTLALHFTGPLHLPPKADPLNRTRGWVELAAGVQTWIDRVQPDILVGNKYQTSSILSFYLPGRPTTYMPHANRILNQYSFWPGYDTARVSRVLFVTDDLGWKMEEGWPLFSAEFPSQEVLTEIPIVRNGKELRRFRLYLLKKS